MSMFFGAGSHQGEQIEIEADINPHKQNLYITQGGRSLGVMRNNEVQQMMQYIVNRGGVDLDQLIAGKAEKDREEAHSDMVDLP